MNLLIAFVGAYVVVAAYTNRLLSLHELLNVREHLAVYVIAWLVLIIVAHSVTHYRSNKERYRRARTMRRHDALRYHVTNGIQAKQFAYLRSEQEYGPKTLVAMSAVYVIHVLEGNSTNGPEAWVVPVGMPGEPIPETDHPHLAIRVPLSELYQYVPRHMVPELI